MTADSKSFERRQHRRIRVDRHFDSVRALLSAYVFDLSVEGAFIATTEPPALGTRLDLRLSVVLEDIVTIEGEADVVRVDVPPLPRPGIAVQFVSLTAPSRAVIERICGGPSLVPTKVATAHSADDDFPSPTPS